MLLPFQRSLAIGACLLAFTACLSGCGYKQRFETSSSDYGSRDNHGPRTTTLSRPNATLIQSSTDHRNKSLAYSLAASDSVAGMKGVRDAYVLVTDKNAYAAILLDQSATGMKGTGDIQISDNTITSNDFHRHLEDSSGRTLQPGVVVTDKYSHIVIPQHDGISSELRTQAEAKILEEHPGLHGVFISANPHFINQMSMFAHAAWQNKPLTPYLDDFNGIVQEVFGNPDTLPRQK